MTGKHLAPKLARRVSRGWAMPLALVLAMIMTSVAWADNFVNTLDTSPDEALEEVTITAGGSTTVGFTIDTTDSADPINGCNATGNDRATLSVSVSSNVIVTGGLTRQIVGCGGFTMTFGSSVPDSYPVTFSISGGKANSTWNTAPAAFTLVVNPIAPTDTTPPVITAMISGAEGNNGWYTGDVIVSWTVTDGESPASQCGPTTVNVDTVGTDVTCTSTSVGGTSAEAVTIKRDATAPSFNCEAPDGMWHDDNVSLACTASDATSDLASASSFASSTSVSDGDEDSNASTDSALVTDLAGNEATAGPIAGNKVDRKGPVVTCVPPAPDLAEWQADNVTFECTAIDGGSGVETGASFSLSTSVGAGEEDDAAMTPEGTATDEVGNSTTVGEFGPARIDRKAPSINIVGPGSGPYVLGSTVIASYSCSDLGSGVKTDGGCIGPVASGDPIDTATVGLKTFTVDAVDIVGNSSTDFARYAVVYATGTCLGSPGRQVLQPVNPDGSSVFKKGSTVPVKFRVCDSNGNSIGSAGVVTSFTLAKYSSGVSGVPNEPIDSTTPDTTFRWSAADQQWIYNLSTKNLLAGNIYRGVITLADGSAINFYFGLK